MFAESFGSVELPLGSGRRDLLLSIEGPIPNQTAIPTNGTPIRTPIAEYNTVMSLLRLQTTTMNPSTLFHQHWLETIPNDRESPLQSPRLPCGLRMQDILRAVGGPSVPDLGGEMRAERPQEAGGFDTRALRLCIGIAYVARQIP